MHVFKLRLLDAIDRRLGHRVRILCRLSAYWCGFSWREAGEIVSEEGIMARYSPEEQVK